MNRPLLDPRTPEALREQLHTLARSYTPEWRYEGTENDPGAALAELFLEMYGQSVNRLNALPEKLFIEFLNMIGYREPGPMPAGGTVCFETPDSTQSPFTIASGTQLFTPDADGKTSSTRPNARFRSRPRRSGTSTLSTRRTTASEDWICLSGREASSNRRERNCSVTVF